MPKQLIALTNEFDDIKKRVGPFLQTMEMLDNNFWNPTNGNWHRYYAGLDMLGDRLLHLNAPNAGHANAVNDPEVLQLLPAIAGAKHDCLQISTEYWNTAQRVQGVMREVVTLKGKVDGVIKQKTEALKKTNSLPALQNLSAHLNTFYNDLNAATSQGPHRPNHPLLQ